MDFSRFQTKSKETERGELMVYFCKKLNVGRKEKGLKDISMGRMGRMLEGIPTADLYYIKSCCDDWENECKPWASLFYTMFKNK